MYDYECCDNCFYCTYNSLSDCYICDLTDDRVELHDEACDDYERAHIIYG